MLFELPEYERAVERYVGEHGEYPVNGGGCIGGGWTWKAQLGTPFGVVDLMLAEMMIPLAEKPWRGYS